MTADEAPAVPAELLPGFLGQVAGILGVAAAVRLAQARGGTKLFLAASGGPASPLVALFGATAVERLVAAIGPGEVVIPNARPLLNWAAARNLRRAGRSANEIALALRLSRRHVFRLVDGVKPADRAGSAADGVEASAAAGSPRCAYCGQVLPH